MTDKGNTAAALDTAQPDPHHAWVCRAANPDSSAPQAGRLGGVQIGVKDVIVTDALPTRFGSDVPAEAFSDLLALGDAECIRQLQAQGATVAGKTVTAELATYSPGPTVNPLAPDHSPGGSSSGSAAAVSAGDVPIALATQTAGSVIRPASFCGVLGFKPSFGSYSTHGILCTSPSLDTLGLIAADPGLLAMVDSVLAPENHGATPVETARRLVLYRTSQWGKATPATRGLIERQFEQWRPFFAASDVRPPQASIEALSSIQRIVHCGEVAEQLGWLADRYPAAVSEAFRAMVREGRSVAGDALIKARTALQDARTRVADLFPADEIWITPAARGPAPLLTEGTGDPLFCRAWTALGIPCATLPASPTEPDALPTGIQLLASKGQDRMLLETLAMLSGLTQQPQGDRR